MNLLIVGLNHHTAPLQLREKAAFGPEEIQPAVTQILTELAGEQSGGVHEAVVLSTCNRMEIYCAADEPALASEALRDFLARNKGLKPSELEVHLYVHLQEQAVNHAFRVASGLDSMVLGETQIAGQMKNAVKAARDCGGMGLYLNHLFQMTFAAAKEVRSRTDISSHSVSLAAAAVRVANRIFGDLTGLNVLFVGAGEMIELCAAHFRAQNPQKITVANRTLERAQALAQTIDADSIKLADLPQVIADYDIIVSCTASALPIIGLGMMQRAIKQRRFRPVFMADLAVPRDIEAEVMQLDQIYVYTIDDLGKVVQSGLANRQAAATEAENLLANRLKEFHDWMLARHSVPSIQQLQRRAEALRVMEVHRAKRLLSKGEPAEEVIEVLSQALMKKFMHDPVAMLRNSKKLSDEDYEKFAPLLSEFFQYRAH